MSSLNSYLLTVRKDTHVDLKEVASKDVVRGILVAYGRTLQVELDLLKTFQATAGAASVSSAVLPGSHQLILKSVEISAKE